MKAEFPIRDGYLIEACSRELENPLQQLQNQVTQVKKSCHNLITLTRSLNASFPLKKASVNTYNANQVGVG